MAQDMGDYLVSRCFSCCAGRDVFLAIAVVASLDDSAGVCEPVEQGGGQYRNRKGMGDPFSHPKP